MSIVLIFKLIPIVILSVGVLVLLKKRIYNEILFGITGLLILETLSFLFASKEIKESSWTLFISGLIYFVLICKLYKSLFFSILNNIIYKFLLILILILICIGIVFIHKHNPNFVYYYITGIELLVLLHPMYYFFKLVKQEIPYQFRHFVLNSIVFLFFGMEVILYGMIKHLLDNGILNNVRIDLFRFFLIQLFYISLIYFGCKLSKK